MRSYLLILFASAAYIASAMPTDEVVGDNVNSRYFEFHDDDGNLQTIDLDAEPDFGLLDEITRNPANNRYFLYTRRNPNSRQELHINNADSVRNSNYNPNHQTVVVSHGWLSNQKYDINPAVRDVFLARGEANILVVDWRRLSYSNYVTAARGVPAVGRGLGQFINFVVNTVGGDLSNFHLVGFSLGAHVVGNAGRELGGRVGRVTGCDPAGPLWGNNNERLNANDGIYVEAIHTDGGLAGLGIGSAIADADFFPNGGNSQPGCLTGICDHNRAWELFVSSVTHDHLVGRLCATDRDVSRDNCGGTTLRLGNSDIRKRGSGMFRVNTGRRYPY